MLLRFLIIEKMKFKILVAVLFLLGCRVYGQEPIIPGEMITDRPDETEAPNLVPKGFLQIETGGFYEEREENDILIKLTGYNTTLLRYGLLDNLEIRIGGDLLGYKEELNASTIAETSSGLTPLLVGAKIGIAEEEGLLPQIGLMLHLRLPFNAAEDYRPETTGVDFRLAFSHELSEKSDLSYNLGAEWLNDATEATYIYTIAYGFDITDHFGVFAELYGDLPENSSAEHFFDAGFTYNLQKNLQLDAFAGTGINANQKLLLGAGISYLIPN